MIKIEKGKGAYVKEFSPEGITETMHLYLQLNRHEDYILDVLQARAIIEPSVAAYAAMHRTEEDIETLKTNIDEMIKAGDNSKLHAKLDAQFHLDIAKASKNPIIPLILTPIQKMMPDIKFKILNTVEDAHDAAIVWHKKILDAIIIGDPELAFSTMKKHIEVAKEHTILLLKLQPAESIKDTDNSTEIDQNTN